MCEGKGGKPSILIASNLDIWLGNPSDEDANFSAQELFGFGLWAFEEKEIRGRVKLVQGTTNSPREAERTQKGPH